MTRLGKNHAAEPVPPAFRDGARAARLVAAPEGCDRGVISGVSGRRYAKVVEDLVADVDAFLVRGTPVLLASQPSLVASREDSPREQAPNLAGQ